MLDVVFYDSVIHLKDDQLRFHNLLLSPILLYTICVNGPERVKMLVENLKEA